MTELLAHYSGSAAGAHQPWLVLKQEGVQDDAATIGDSGDLIDKLFDLSPCTKQIEGGEEAVVEVDGEPAAPLDLNEARTIIREEYGFAGCGDGDGDRYLLRVYRSDLALPYKLLFDNGEQVSVVRKNDTYQAVIAVDMDDRADLDYPVADPARLQTRWRTIRDRSGSMAAVPVSVVGQYLQFPREVAGLLEIAYPVAYDLVEIRIPRKGSEPGKCRVTALYAGAAYEIDIEPVKLDPAMDGFARRFGCSGGDDDYEFPDSDEPVCYERIYHRVLCRCTREDAKSYQQNIGGDSLSYTTEGEVPCPDWLTKAGYSGRFAMGSRSVIEKYVDCGGAVEGTGTAQEYENICCEPGTPPECDTIYRKFAGGKAFDRQAAIAEYGENVVLIPVGPADGQCGEWVTEYQKPGGNCCDTPPAMFWESTTDTLDQGESFVFRVDSSSGVPPFTWSAGTGLSISPDGAQAMVTASDCFCGPADVVVTDSCDQELRHAVTPESTAGCAADFLYDDENSADVIADNSSAYIFWEGGKAPFWVEVSGQGFYLDASFQLQAYQFSGRQAKIYTADACGTCFITITDQCGDTVESTVTSTIGDWEEIYRNTDGGWVGYDGISPPPIYTTKLYGRVEGYTENYKVNQSFSDMVNRFYTAFKTEQECLNYCQTHKSTDAPTDPDILTGGVFYNTPGKCDECGKCVGEDYTATGDSRSIDVGFHSRIWPSTGDWISVEGMWQTVTDTTIWRWSC